MNTTKINLSDYAKTQLLEGTADFINIKIKKNGKPKHRLKYDSVRICNGVQIEFFYRDKVVATLPIPLLALGDGVIINLMEGKHVLRVS